MLFSPLCRVVLAPFQALSVAEKLASLKLFLSTLTQNVLFMSDVVKEVTKWLRYLVNSQNLVLKLRERNTILCRELAWSLIPLTCLSLQEKLLFTQVSLLLNISEIWVSTSV